MSKYFLIYNFLKKKIGHDCARIILNDVILYDEKMYNLGKFPIYQHRSSLSRTIHHMRHKKFSGYAIQKKIKRR